MPSDAELVELEARRDELREQYLKPPAERPSTTGRGIHHAALICSDVEQTIQFYQACSGSRSSSWSRTATTRAPRTSSSTSATRRCSASSTSPASAWSPASRRSAASSTSRSPCPRDRWEQVRDQLDAAGVKYAGPRPRDRGVDVLQGPGRHPDRAAQRPADVLRRQAARRIARHVERGRGAGMTEWNAMTYEGKDTILRVVRAEAERYASPSPSRPTPGTCRPPATTGRPRDVVAHIIDTTEGYFRAFDAARRARRGPDAARAAGDAREGERGRQAFRGVPQAELMQRLRDDFQQDAGAARRRSGRTTGPG